MAVDGLAALSVEMASAGEMDGGWMTLRRGSPYRRERSYRQWHLPLRDLAVCCLTSQSRLDDDGDASVPAGIGGSDQLTANDQREKVQNLSKRPKAL